MEPEAIAPPSVSQVVAVDHKGRLSVADGRTARRAGGVGWLVRLGLGTFFTSPHSGAKPTRRDGRVSGLAPGPGSSFTEGFWLGAHGACGAHHPQCRPAVGLLSIWRFVPLGGPYGRPSEVYQARR